MAEGNTTYALARRMRRPILHTTNSMLLIVMVYHGPLQENESSLGASPNLLKPFGICQRLTFLLLLLFLPLPLIHNLLDNLIQILILQSQLLHRKRISPLRPLGIKRSQHKHNLLHRMVAILHRQLINLPL